MAFTRRHFIALSSIALFAAGGAIRWVKDPRETYIVAVLRKHLDYLTFSDADAEAFAADYVTNDPKMGRIEGRALSWVGRPVSATLARVVGGEFGGKIVAKEERIAAAFLLSTDFFYRDADDDDALTYEGLADPYLTPCQNPFARLA